MKVLLSPVSTYIYSNLAKDRHDSTRIDWFSITNQYYLMCMIAMP